MGRIALCLLGAWCLFFTLFVGYRWLIEGETRLFDTAGVFWYAVSIVLSVVCPYLVYRMTVSERQAAARRVQEQIDEAERLELADVAAAEERQARLLAQLSGLNREALELFANMPRVSPSGWWGFGARGGPR